MRLTTLLLVIAAFAIAPRASARDDVINTGERDPDFIAGKQALERKDWPEAIKALGRVGLREPDNADVQNLLGFAWRNTGKYNLAFRHYERALELNPGHTGAHEYIGEAYLKVGDLRNAEKHLARLRSLCPQSCEALVDLEQAVAQYRKQK